MLTLPDAPTPTPPPPIEPVVVLLPAVEEPPALLSLPPALLEPPLPPGDALPAMSPVEVLLSWSMLVEPDPEHATTKADVEPTSRTAGNRAAHLGTESE
jgi:hypothetical protein